MANTVIQLKKSGTPSATPSSLANGELAINYADGKLFYKAANGTILQFVSGGSSFNFSTVNANSTLVVADATDDILSIVSGNNITIVGDAINDRITIGLKDDVVIPSSGSFKVAAVGGDEGGEIKLANAITNSVLTGDIIIDIYQNKLRFFESTGTNRGAFIDLSIAGTGVSSNLLAGGTGGGGGTTDTTARDWAAAAFAKANTANTTADAAYGQANLAFTRANTANITADLAFGQANLAFAQANTANITADAAFNQTNLAFARANTANTTADAAFGRANLAYSQANTAYTRANSIVSVSNTAPSSPTQGNLWWDTDIGTMYLYYDDGTSTQWVETTPRYQAVTISTTPPALPAPGDLWWDPDAANMFVYYSNTFVQATATYLTQGPIGTFTLTGNLTLTSNLTISGDATVQGTLFETSDVTLKENIETFPNALQTVKDLRGVTFDWKKNKSKSAGVIAQEIEQILPYLVNEELDGKKTVNYSAIIGVLIEAVKELSDKIEGK